MAIHERELAIKQTNEDILANIRWRPTIDTSAALVSYVFVVAAMYLAFQVFTTERVAANFITFGPITLAGLGIAVPLFYTVVVRQRPLTDLGITTYQLIPSLILSGFLGWDTYRNTVGLLDVSWTQSIVPIATMVLAVGLFEAIFFRGWLQLRFEAAFGLVPGLLIGALCYSLYHVGYGMDPDELLFLFGLGLVFGAFFRLTKSIFVLWPLYTPMGGLYTNLSDGLSLPFEATYGFLITIGIMVAIIIVAHKIQKPRTNLEMPS